MVLSLLQKKRRRRPDAVVSEAHKQPDLKPTILAALALAFASFGDAFLYPFLPVNYDAAGVPVVWVGLLLSINRFIRIGSNTLIVHASSKYGLRLVMITAVILAVLSTLGYAFATGVVVWLVLRTVWGLSFSAMRLGTIGYALQNNRTGLALGVSRSLQELGPLLALMIAPMLLQHVSSTLIFYLLAILSLPSIYFAWRLPIVNDKTQPFPGKIRLQWPSSLNTITLISAMVIDGILVVTLGILFLQNDRIDLMTATTLAALYLGYRRICLVTFPLVGGWAADRIGTERIFSISLALVIIGFILLTAGWVRTGSVMVFTFYSIHVAITPGTIAKNHTHGLRAVSDNATWRDIGAAVGTLLGGFLLVTPNLNYILLIATFGLMVVLGNLLVNKPAGFRTSYLWK